MRSRRIWTILVVGVVAFASVFSLVQNAAAVPQSTATDPVTVGATPPPDGVHLSDGIATCTQPNPPAQCNSQDPTFLALKAAGRINSGVYPGEPKGAHTAPSVMPSAPPLGDVTMVGKVGGAAIRQAMTSTYSWGN